MYIKQDKRREQAKTVKKSRLDRSLELEVQMDLALVAKLRTEHVYCLQC